MVVTLWGSTAEGPGQQLEGLAGQAPIAAITACRVSSYNGVSGAQGAPLVVCVCVCGACACGANRFRVQLGYPSGAPHFHCIACAVSSLQRSAVLINPDISEAVALRQWYDTEGRGAITTHVGEGLATALK